MFARANLPDFAFAAFLLGLGALAYYMASDLSVGSAAAMGPGYVPRGLAVIVMLYGAVMAVRAMLAGREDLPELALRPLLMIGLSVALFAILLPFAGLAFTAAAVVIAAGFAAYDVRLRENVMLAAGLATFSVLLFVIGLGLPIKLWPW